MTLPRTAAEVLSGHVRFEIRSVDRMLLLLRQPRLQYGQGIHGFFCHHRRWRFVSSELMRQMTESFTAELHHYVASRGLDLVHFEKDQRKDDVASVLAAGEQPAGGEPHRQRRPGPIEDRARSHRGAGPAASALEPSVVHPPATAVTAPRTDEPVWPAQPLQVVQAIVIRTEPT